MIDPTPRWRYRFANYERAFALLSEAVETGKERPLSQLEKEGVVQRFEYTTELAWKLMRDYLEHQGVAFPQVTPRAVIREAFAAGLVSDGQGWMDALDDRNLMSHIYDPAQFERIVAQVAARHIHLFADLNRRLSPEAGGGRS